MAEGVTVANAFVQVMPSMEGATTGITNALVPGLTQAGEKAGTSFGTIFSGKVGTAMKALGGAMIGFFAFDKLASAYGEVEAGLNNLKIATGATGEAANGLKEVYLDVSKSVVGSFEDIGSAVGEINTRLGLEGEELEKASEAMMKYAKITGQDATKATQDVASMMRNVGIPTTEMADTLGKLTVAGQKAGIDVGNLANNVTKYNSVMKQLGLTTDEQIALMAQFEVSGADTNSILNAMKRGVASWAKEGKDARTEFENFVKGVQDGTVTAGDAVEIFGSRGGLSMYEAASKGQLSFDDMFKSISSASEKNLDDIYRDTLTAEEKFGILGKNLQAGFFEIMEPIVDAISPFIDDIVSFVSGAISIIVGIITPFMEMIGGALDELHAWLEPIYAEVDEGVNNTVVPAIQSVIQWVGEQLTPIINELANWINTNVVPAFKKFADFIMNTVVPDLQKLWAWIQQNIIPIFNTLADTLFNHVAPALGEIVAWIVANVLPAIQSAYLWVRDNVLPVIDRLVQFLNQHVIPVLATVANFVFDQVGPAFQAIAGWVGGVVGPAFEGLIGILSTVLGFLEGVISKISEAISWMVSFEENRVAHMGSDNINDYQYAGFASGGFTDGEGLYVAGERGGEFIWPSYEPYMSRYASALASRMGGGSARTDNLLEALLNKSGTVVIDGKSIGRVLAPIVDSEFAATSRRAQYA